MPHNPTLSQEGELRVTVKAVTAEAVLARLWVLPPGATAWQNPQDIADGSSTISDTTTYNVVRGTYLGWNVSVGTTHGSQPYHVTLTLRQAGQIVQDGVLDIEGTTDANGEDVDIDKVLLQ